MLMSFFNGGQSRAVVGGFFAAVLIALASQGAFAQQGAKRVIDTQEDFDRGSSASQQRVDRYAQQTSELLSEYRLVLQQLDRVRIYNDNLQKVVDDQNASIAKMQDDLENFDQTEQGIVPLMLTMIADLRQFIEADMPFQRESRMRRIANLEASMTSSDITNSEKYRQIMDAYRIETEYGDTIEAYEGTIDLNGVETTVDFLRVGRIVLAYQTPDQKVTGMWNKQSGTWEVRDSGYRRAVSDGLSLARKQAPPQLLNLPVPAPEAAQ